MKYRVEATKWSAVGLCLEAGCGVRVLSCDRLGALRLLDEHESVAHPEPPFQAHEALVNRLWRLGRKREALRIVDLSTILG